jgi:hypothetical protein
MDQERGMDLPLACSRPEQPSGSHQVHTQPNPTPLATLIRSEATVSGHRNLYCFHYDACLDVAVKLDWDSWSCEKCPLFRVQEQPRSFAGNFANDRRGGPTH